MGAVFGSAFNDNRAKTPEGRLEQDKQSWNYAASALAAWGISKVAEKAITSFSVNKSNLDEPVTIPLKMKKGWSNEQQAEAINKVDKINSLNPVVAENPVERVSNLRGKFTKGGGC